MGYQALRHDGRIRVPALYATPCMKFDLQSEINRLYAEQPWQAGHTARTIAKYADLRLVLVAMKAGSRLVEHRTSGRISVQVLSGLIRLQACGEGTQMPVGSLLTLDRNLLHEVEAVEDSAFLLTIAWPESEEVTADVVKTRTPVHAPQRMPVPAAWQYAECQPHQARIEPFQSLRERGLDKTLADTFPCSDALSTIPDPVLVKAR